MFVYFMCCCILYCYVHQMYIYIGFMKKEEQALLIFERKIFRRMCGPKYENGELKSRTNRELEEIKAKEKM